MNTRDQFFLAGEKVMMISRASDLGLPTTGCVRLAGMVLCVLECWTSHRGYNVVRFVGIEDEGRGFYACCFRRIEEIQLCVRAAEKFKQNEEVEV